MRLARYRLLHGTFGGEKPGNSEKRLDGKEAI
jgi:hypothetical protein